MKPVSLFIMWLGLWINQDMWKLFENVPFESRYVEDEKASFYFPTFSGDILKWNKKRVEISGYYLPIDLSPDAIVLSRYPMATCFFCGEAGPESVVMVYTRHKQRGLKMDQKVTFEGTLELNDTDIYQLSFILKDAVRL